MTQQPPRIDQTTITKAQFAKKKGRFKRVPYPEYTGMEPCTQIGVEVYYSDDLPKDEQPDWDFLAGLCKECPMLMPCMTWALHREQYGFWAGTTPKRRAQLRTELGIAFAEAQYVDEYLRLQAEADRLRKQQETGRNSTDVQTQAS